MKKYQILFEDGELAECVGFYTGANDATGIPVFKTSGKYYLMQNPTSGSMFGSFSRRGYLMYWELNEFPDRKKGLKYTGNIVFLFKLQPAKQVRNIIIQIAKKERELLNKK